MTDLATIPAVALGTRLGNAMRAAGFSDGMTKPVDGGRIRVHFRCTDDALESLTVVSHALKTAGFQVVHVQIETGSWSFVDVLDAAR